MVPIDTVLLKVASRCNLDCSYCYVYHMGDESWRSQPKRIPDEVVAATALQLGELARYQDRPFSVVLHGGEPLMLGPARLREVFGALRRELPPTHGLHVQTNGLLLTDAVIDVCASHDVGISISLDGPMEVHDRFRRDHRNRGSHARVVAAVERLLRHPSGERLFSGILAVVDPNSDPLAVYEALKSTGAPAFDFLYRDGNHDRLPFGKQAFATTEYGEWMVQILESYLRDRSPPRIRLLDDLMRLVLGGQGRKEGVGLTDFGILVIDTDGSLNKNDTLKSTHPEADRFAEGWSVLRDRLVDVVGSAAFLEYNALQRPTAKACLECPDLAVCGGGMPAHRWSNERAQDNPSVYCHDQKLLIARVRRILEKARAA